MKLLYIGHFNNNDKWGENARINVEHLSAEGLDIVCRSIMDKNNIETPESIKALQNKDLKDVTHCIQHVKVQHLVPTGLFKNVALLEDSLSIPKKYMEVVQLMGDTWLRKFLTPDNWPLGELRVDIPSVRSINSKTSYLAIPPIMDTSIYSKDLPEVNIPNQDQNFIFYTVMNYSSLKDLSGLLTAFHLAFDINSPVSLVIKARSNEMDERTLFNHISGVSERVKNELGDGDYIQEVILCGNLPNDQVMGIHKYGHCFIDTSLDLSWDNNIFHALAMGKQILSHNSFMKYITNSQLTTKPHPKSLKLENFHPVSSNSIPGLSRTPENRREYLRKTNTRSLIKNMEDVFKTNKRESEVDKKFLEFFKEEDIINTMTWNLFKQ